MDVNSNMSLNTTSVQLDSVRPISKLKHETGFAKESSRLNADVYQGVETAKQGSASPRIGDMKTPSLGPHFYEKGLQHPEWYTQLSDDNINVFKKLFEMLSSSNDSAVTANSLYKELQRLDSGIAMEEVEYVINRIKNDGNETIHFDEFLLHMTDIADKVVSNGTDSAVGKSKLKKYTKRQRLFYSAIANFSLPKTLQEIDKTYISLAHQPAPHVLPYYTAGWHLIGLAPLHLAREIKRMQKKIGNSDSPYAKPLPFLIQQTISKRRKQRGKKTKRAFLCKKASSLTSNKHEKSIVLVPQLSKETLDDEVKESLRFLAARGSVVAKLPDAHLILELRQRIYSVSTKLRQSCTTPVESSSGIEGCESSGNSMEMIPAKCSFGTNPKLRDLSQTTVREPILSAQKPDRIRNPPSKFLDTFYSPVPIRVSKMLHLSCTTPAESSSGIKAQNRNKKRNPPSKSRYTSYSAVPIRGTVIVPQSVICGVFNALNSTSRAKIRYKTTCKCSCRTQKALENFKQVYMTYTPQKEDDTFLIYPWIPGPFGYVKQSRKNLMYSRSTLSSTSQSGRRSRRIACDIVCRPKTVAV
ncbi:hypothetical protein ACJMK2_041509 [Sinanodonta woodiana]|uniref:EF-hand domain-containing protein n=1 Tax=Sinanodonta woodiana TaxID=1069815 RepID=A0ABD3W5D2_SINWO